jgi:lysozyme family protein
MTDPNALTRRAKRWANARLTRALPLAKRLVAPEAKARYQAVEKRTGVPWAFIAVAHERECSQDWTGSLAQGDPWNRVSVHVPKGRGRSNLGKMPRSMRWSIAGLMPRATRIGALAAS